MSKKLQEVIEFFEFGDGYDKDEIIADILNEIKWLRNHSADEISLNWGNGNDSYLMGLDEFSEEFYSKVIEKVCNVLKSFRG